MSVLEGATRNPLSSADADRAPTGLAAEALQSGVWFVAKESDEWTWARFGYARAETVTAKLVKFRRHSGMGLYGSQIKRDDILAVFDNEQDAATLTQSLDGVRGQYRQQAAAAERDFKARKSAAADAAEKQAAKLVSKALGSK